MQIPDDRDILIIMLLAPAIAALIALAVDLPRLAEMVNLLAALVVFACVLSLPFIVRGHCRSAAWLYRCGAALGLGSALHRNRLSARLDLCRRLHAACWASRIACRDFYMLFATFALTMLLAPLMNNIGLYWIAIELTTLVSTFLIGFEHAAEAIEAAWKYIMIVSAGISLALLGTIFLYWDGSLVLGPTYQMTWQALQAVAPRLEQPVLLLAFLLMLIGYGTKVGLAPMHNWLPDAHSEGPAPVSVMLSGALLNTAMIGIVRFLAIADAAGIGLICHAALLVLGALSLLVATLFIVRQNGVKRLMAYSSIEHMGVIALGFGFGGVLGIAGSLYHMVNHSLNKSLMFFGAGNCYARLRHQGDRQDTGRGRAVPGSGLILAGRCRRHNRRPALWPVPQ